MNALFAYPQAATVNRVIPKTRIYEHAKAGKKLRRLFVDQLDQIVWQYKLAPESINLDSTDVVKEIQIFQLRLRVKQYNEDILRAIDKAIPSPIIFELTYGHQHKTAVAYKRPNQTNRTKRIVSEYLGSQWKSGEPIRKPLPHALNLETLYTRMLDSLIPEGIGAGESIPVRIQNIEAIRAKQREAERIRAQLKQEKQFNKRIAINAKLRKITEQLEHLGATALAEQ